MKAMTVSAATRIPVYVGTKLIHDVRLELEFDLADIDDFPVKLSGEELYRKICGGRTNMGFARSEFANMTNLRCDDPTKVRLYDYSGYPEKGEFVGYIRGVVHSPAALGCPWGNDCVEIPEERREEVLAINRLEDGRFFAGSVGFDGHLKLAKVLGVDVEELFIKSSN